MNEPFDIEKQLADDLPTFSPGQLVKHRRYHYRGIIVDFDMRCLANNDWYEQNRTQPDRDQPWYHVLVDDSTLMTYAAQSSLQADDSNQPIHHPLINHFFSTLDNGQYLRNDRPLQELY